MHLTILDILAIAAPLAVLQVALLVWAKIRWETALQRKYETLLAGSKQEHESLLTDGQRDPAKNREVRLQHLLEAYRRLEAAAQREDLSPYEDGVESAIAVIQLLGTPAQAGLAGTFVKVLTDSHKADLARLLQDLRDDLRKEFSLEPITGKPVHLRFTQKAVM